MRKFLSMIVHVLPEKAFVVMPLMEPAITTDPVKTAKFMFSIVKTLSEFNCTDIDDLTWNKVPLIPSNKELLRSPLNDSTLSPVILKGPYDDPEAYMDTYFRLLRADCFDSLRLGIQAFLSGTLNQADMNMYMAVTIKGINIGENNLPISIALEVTPVREISDWKFSSNLMYGNLLCISPRGTFQDAIWATVVQRDVEELQKKQLIWVSLCDEINANSEAHCISVLQKASGKIIMAESPTFYLAYKPVLKALQGQTPGKLPFLDELVYTRWQKPSSLQETTGSLNENKNKSDSILPDAFSPRNVIATPSKEPSSDEQLFSLKEEVSSSIDEDPTQSDGGDPMQSDGDAPQSSLGRYTYDMDKSQALAFESCLKKGISIIQGPPGTGKTFVGIRLVKYFLENAVLKRGPILVLTYKNHALDEMLKSILAITQDVVRVGGKSKEPDLANYNLQALKRKHHGTSIRSRREFLDEAKEIQKQLQSTFDIVKSHHECLPHAMISCLESEQIQTFLERCPWKRIGNWTKKDVMHLWQKHSNMSSEKDNSDASNDKALKGKLLTAFQAATNFWLPSPNVFETQRSFEEKASKMFANIVRPTMNAKEKDKKDPQEDNADEDDIEVKQKEEERLLTASAPQKQRLNIHVQMKQGSHSYLDSRNSVVNDIPPHMLRGFGDLWSKDAYERAIIAQVITDDFQSKTELALQSLIDRYKRILSSIDQLHVEEKIEILKGSDVVGMTFTGASMYQTLVQGIQPSIVLVEEAAEVLEPQILAVLGDWVQQLILIGDHKQLKPPVESYRLIRNYHFDLSMMERLINNGYSYSQLAMQNRMLPEMATLLMDIYPELESNLETVSKNTPPDFTEPIFFWDHTDTENPGGRSYCNRKEANRVIALARVFITQGYPAERVTILSAYQGQTRLLRRLFRENTCHDHSEKKEEGNPREGPNFQTIDNYQGDENDIVIVSLVRSNDQGNIGFLKSLNRRCVAQSRARLGMYFVGSKSTLCQSRNGSWKYLLDQLEARNQIGPAFPIHCPKHSDITIIKAAGPDNIPVQSICEIRCSSQMECGVHRCPKSCQPPHEHSPVLCRSIVGFTFFCGHPGTRLCRIPEKSLHCKRPCEEQMTCGHPCQAKCQPKHENRHNKYFCPVIIDFVPKCGHPGKKECGENELHVPCKQQCPEEMVSCGHSCKRRCTPSHSHENFLCEKMVSFTFSPCGHKGKKQCGESDERLKCYEKVPVHLELCGHKGEKYCHEKLSEVKCKEKCCCKMECGHMCDGICGDTCDPSRCPECKKIRKLELEQQRAAEEALRKAARNDALREYKCLSKVVTKCSLVEIVPNGDTTSEYWDVEDRVRKYVQSGHNWFPEVVKIEKVTNIALYKKWLRAKSELYDPTRSELKFHGSSSDSVSNIVKSGFKSPRNAGVYGRGIYFATDASKSAQSRYTNDNNKILLCDVLIGKSLTLSSADPDRTLKQVKQEGYDSVFVKRSTESSGGAKFDGYVIYQPTQVLPKYVIHFGKCSMQDTKLQLDVLEESVRKKGGLERHAMTAKRAFTFQDPLDVHYRLAESQFLRLSKRMIGNPVISSIEYCINPQLVERFRTKEKDFQKKYAGQPEADTVLAFHGTRTENIDAIVQENFKIEKCARSLYGSGIYFSEFPDVSADYASGSTRKLLLCNILPGRSYHCDRSLTGQTLKQGFDSHMVRADKHGRAEMVVINNPDQILPSYIITYG